MTGTNVALTRPPCLFSVHFQFEGVISVGLAWKATSLTKNLALVSTWEEGDFDSTWWQWEPVGLAETSSLFQSTALLFIHHAANGNGIGYLDFNREGSHDLVAVSGITGPELYRLALGRYGVEEVFTMDAEEIINFRRYGIRNDYGVVMGECVARRLCRRRRRHYHVTAA